MSFDAALRDLLRAHGPPPSDVADQMAGVRNRVTFYRVPSGDAPSAEGEKRFVNMANVTELARHEGGTRIVFSGFAVDNRGKPYWNTSDVKEPPEKILDVMRGAEGFSGAKSGRTTTS